MRVTFFVNMYFERKDRKAAEAAQIQQEVQAKVDQATELVNSLDAEAKELLEQEQAAAAAAAAWKRQRNTTSASPPRT